MQGGNVRIEERFHYPLKQYRDDLDVANVVIVHKLYTGYRYVLDGSQVVSRDKIGKWGPYGYKCNDCGFYRSTYEAIIKHRQTCKKVDNNNNP